MIDATLEYAIVAGLIYATIRLFIRAGHDLGSRGAKSGVPFAATRVRHLFIPLVLLLLAHGLSIEQARAPAAVCDEQNERVRVGLFRQESESAMSPDEADEMRTYAAKRYRDCLADAKNDGRAYGLSSLIVLGIAYGLAFESGSKRRVPEVQDNLAENLQS